MTGRTNARGHDRTELRPVTERDVRFDFHRRDARAVKGPPELLLDDGATPDRLVLYEQLSLADAERHRLLALQRHEGRMAGGNGVGTERARRRVGMELMRCARKQLQEVASGSLPHVDASLVVWSPNSVISVIGRIRHRRHRIARAKR